MGNGWLGDLGGLLGGIGTIYGLSQLGGRGPTPSAGKTTQEAFQAYQDYYPTQDVDLIKAGAAKPGYAQIMRDETGRDLAAQLELVNRYGQDAAEQELDLAKAFIPQYGQLASDEAYREALRRSGTQVDVLRGPGGELIDEAYAKAQQVDQPFYQQRAAAGGMLGDLLRSFADPRTQQQYTGGGRDADGRVVPLVENPMYDPNRPGGYFTGALSGGEREEIQRSLNQQAARTGGLSGPRAMTDVVADAMTFGQGVQNRRDALGRALGQATSFLPASRSGFDPLQVALGRPSQQFGAQQFSQPNLQTNTAAQSGNFLNNTFGAAGQSASFAANAPTMLDRLGQGVGVLQNIGKLGW